MGDREEYVLHLGGDLMVPGIQGSVVSVDRNGEFHYVNRLATPGRTLMQWQSGPYRAASCRQPELPPAPRGRRVYIRVCWDMKSPKDYYFEADYLDQKGRAVCSQRAVRSNDREADFVTDSCFGRFCTSRAGGESGSEDWLTLSVPQETDFWRLRLVQSGEGELRIYAMELYIGEKKVAWSHRG